MTRLNVRQSFQAIFSGNLFRQPSQPSRSRLRSKFVTWWRMAKVNKCVLIFILAISLSRSSVFGAKNILSEKTTVTTSAHTKRETDVIKSQLESAEGRVRELLADLETFSSHASKAKAEIHSSLLDTWKNVELLAQDRCGSELDSMRALLKKADTKKSELEEEIRTFSRVDEERKLQLAQSAASAASLQREVSAERARRESVEAEVHELRDKLQWATATANESRSYDIVADRLQSLLLVVTERGQLLQRILRMVTDHHSGYEDWRKELDTLAELLRDVNYKTAGNYKSAAADVLKRQVADLERRLKDSQKIRDDLVNEKSAMRSTLEKVRASEIASSVSLSGGRVIYQHRQGVSIVGVVTACVMTLLCGAAALLLCSCGERKTNSEIPERTMDQMADRGASGYPTPEQKAMPSIINPPSTSPVTYTTGSGSGRRNLTPRRY